MPAMRVGNIRHASFDALSALDWWELAGVDIIVDEEPRDWLARPKAPARIDPAPAEPAQLPATIAAMQTFLNESPLFGSGIRLAPQGNPASGLMLLTGMPEAEDADTGNLLSGDVGRLFDRMLAAIGRDRAAVYLASLVPARPIGGALRPEDLAAAAPVALHHVALAAPRALLLLGNEASRAILGMSLAEARGRMHRVNHQGFNLAVIATFHPRFLLQQPARKADAWSDLRLLLGEFGL